MEHVVQFAIGIDDDAIRKELEANAVKQIEKEIKQDLIDNLFDSRKTNYFKQHADPNVDPLQRWAESLIAKTLESCKDQIIERAAEILAESMKRTKIVREATQKVVKEV